MDRLSRWLPVIVVVLGVAYIGSSARPAPTILDPYTRLAWTGPLRGMWYSGPSANPRDRMHLAAFGKLPILDKGRIKPIDTYARNHLMLASRREEWRDADGTAQPAVRWLLNLLSAGMASHVNLMRIADPEVRDWFGLPPDQGEFVGANRVVRLLQGKKAEFQKILEKKQDAKAKLTDLEEKVYRTAAEAVTRSQQATDMIRGLGKEDEPYSMRVFRIDFDQILHILKLERREGLRYSAEEIGDGALRIRQRAMQGQARIEAKDPKKPADITDHRAIELAEQLQAFSVLGQLGGVRMVPDKRLHADRLEDPGPGPGRRRPAWQAAGTPRAHHHRLCQGRRGGLQLRGGRVLRTGARKARRWRVRGSARGVVLQFRSAFLLRPPFTSRCSSSPSCRGSSRPRRCPGRSPC